MTRRSPTWIEILASALLELQRLRGAPIDRDAAKRMSAGEIRALFHFDHDAGYAAHGTDNHPTRITPRLIEEHREKRAKVHLPVIAKCRRLSRDHAEFRARLLAKQGVEQANKPHWLTARGHRPLPCGRDSPWCKPLMSNAVRRVR
jgi:hypothetical protein